MVSKKYYQIIEDITRELDDEMLEWSLKGLSDDEFERWLDVYKKLKPFMRLHTGVRRCKDCSMYPCSAINNVKKRYPMVVEIWYETGSACTLFQPKKELLVLGE